MSANKLMIGPSKLMIGPFKLMISTVRWTGVRYRRGVSYPGPPPTTPPPHGWRPPVVAQPAPPRTLPDQDHAALSAEERRARLVTWAIGAGAGVVALLISCVLLGRVLF